MLVLLEDARVGAAIWVVILGALLAAADYDGVPPRAAAAWAISGLLVSGIHAALERRLRREAADEARERPAGATDPGKRKTP